MDHIVFHKWLIKQTKKHRTLFVQDTLQTTSIDHRGIDKDGLLRRDICTDEYIRLKEQRLLIIESPGHSVWSTLEFNDDIAHQ